VILPGEERAIGQTYGLEKEKTKKDERSKKERDAPLN